MNTYILRYRYRGKVDVVTETVYDSDFAVTLDLLCNLLRVRFLSISRVN